MPLYDDLAMHGSTLCKMDTLTQPAARPAREAHVRRHVWQARHAEARQGRRAWARARLGLVLVQLLEPVVLLPRVAAVGVKLERLRAPPVTIRKSWRARGLPVPRVRPQTARPGEQGTQTPLPVPAPPWQARPPPGPAQQNAPASLTSPHPASLLDAPVQACEG